MNRNMRQWLEELRRAEKKKALPILSFPAVQLMGISVRELISDSDRQAEGMKLIADRVDAAASVSLMDLSVEAECFGASIVVSEDEVPTVKGSVVSAPEEAEALAVPPVGAGRTDIYIKAIEKAATLISDRPVFAGMIGPYSLAGRLLDVTEIMLYCYDEPEMVETLLGKVTEFLTAYGKAYKEAGADGIVLAEPLAGLLSPSLAEEFSAPYVKRIVEALQDESFLVIYHNCGNCTIQMIDSILDTGAAAYHKRHRYDADAAPDSRGHHCHGEHRSGRAVQERHTGEHPESNTGTDEGMQRIQEFPHILRVRYSAYVQMGEHRCLFRGGCGLL